MNRDTCFSIIIPTFNQAIAIQRVLDGVLREIRGRTDVQVIVVDSSDDGTTEKIRSDFSGIELLHPVQRALPGPARNLGAAHAQGEYLIFLDGDCLPAQGWWTGFLRAVETIKMGIICGAVDLDEPADLAQFMEYVVWKLPENSRVARGAYEFVITENMMISKSDFSSLGGFGDSDSANDAQFDSARRSLNLPVTFEPTARVLHIHPRGWRYHVRKLYRIGKETYVLIATLPNYPTGRQIRRVFPLAFLAKWMRITWRIIRLKPEWLARYLFVQPLLWIGLLAYQAGLWEGYWLSRTAKSRRLSEHAKQ